MISILVVDDTILYRKLVSDIAAGLPGLRVVGTAPNGKIALSRIAMLKPDLVTLDVEMPEMNGIEVLEAAREAGMPSAFLMVSALTTKGAELSLRAIELGALDAVAKPDGKARSRESFELELRIQFESFARRQEIRKILGGRGAKASAAPGATGAPQAPATPTESGARLAEARPAFAAAPGGATSPDAAPRAAASPPSTRSKRPPCEIVAIGISTGGPAALLELIPSLPAELPVPILIVQHMPAFFTASLANSLELRGRLRCKEGENGEVLKPGIVYIAPGGRHMRVDLGADATTKLLRVTDDPPENQCRPSVDYLFRSVARHYYGRALALVMTGMGEDGASAAGDIKRAGGFVLAQDEESSVVWGMPGATVARGFADAVLPLRDLAGEIVARLS
ncbi:MAG TPA: chemotaxis-specific protein-glutamate methyltransferase CheB [Rectinemataceae bacterium]|nr:chemotaxis-specific protein-glutamate methyltransferase CheB [Rectinemataceae bacterium]